MTRRVFFAATALVVLLCVLITQQAGRPVHASVTRPDAAALPKRLAETGLYASGSTTEIAAANRAFSPQYPLWTDGLTKRRWIYLPPGSTIDGRDEANWDFPVGTRFWKEFSAAGRPVETRMSWKAAHDRWIFATYEWSADGTEAVLAPEGGRLTDVEVAPERRHGIPSRTDCTACHGAADPRPLGFTALQLSPDRDPNSIHGEPLRNDMVTLQTLVAEGLLVNSRADLVTAAPRIRTNDPQTRSVLGYLVGNCSMCHNGDGEITASGPVIRYRELIEDGDAVARSLVESPTRWRIPGVDGDGSVLMAPGAPQRSAILARMRSRSPSSQMPPLGTAVRDQAAVDAITRWIADSARWTNAAAAARRR